MLNSQPPRPENGAHSDDISKLSLCSALRVFPRFLRPKFVEISHDRMKIKTAESLLFLTSQPRAMYNSMQRIQVHVQTPQRARLAQCAIETHSAIDSLSGSFAAVFLTLSSFSVHNFPGKMVSLGFL